MRLFAIVLILKFHLTQIFAYPPNSFELSSQANYGPKGYECGDVFFTDNEINSALTVARTYLGKKYYYPHRYRGELYIESEFEEYFLYPIHKGRLSYSQADVSKSNFRIVFTRHSDEAVDVLAIIATGDYAKCTQRGSTNVEPSHSVPEIPNGYLCGNEFFTDEIIYQNLALARGEVEGMSKDLRPYVGHMYPRNIGHLMWPLMKEDIFYQNRRDRTSPYQLILSNEGNVVDVVVQEYKKNFLRCMRSRRSPKAPASDQYNKLLVPPPKLGYLCSRKFFRDDVIEGIAKELRHRATEANKNILIKYSGPPFNQPCLIWPLLRKGKRLRSGLKDPYRLILTPQYKVLKVAMYANGIYKSCEIKMLTVNKNHDTSNFHCNQKIFTHQQLLRAAEEACVRITDSGIYHYPKNYVGPGFEKEGLYLIYPAFQTGVYSRKVGPNRVVINTNCEVVGALTTIKDDTSKERLVRCHRLADGPLPSGFFGAHA